MDMGRWRNSFPSPSDDKIFERGDRMLGDYYWKAPLYEPPFFQNREFAIFKNGQVIRHLAFPDVQKLRMFLIEQAPDHVYFSSAKYEHPAIEDMKLKKKYWLGSDLVFDIDYDHLRKPILKEALRQAKKLGKVLVENFGFEDLMLTFSGSRGYHVHVRDECIQKCTNAERREIADYFVLPYHPGKKTKKGKDVKNKNFVEIDAPITGDFTRLMRLPGSLHGKTGNPCEIIAGG